MFNESLKFISLKTTQISMEKSKLKQENSETQAKNSRFRYINLVHLPKTYPN